MIEAANAVEAFRAYCDAMREFLAVVESCTHKGWPDIRRSIADAFRSQRLCIQRDLIRIEYLAAHTPEALERVGSLTDISKRLDQDWRVEENNAIARQNSQYEKLENEIRYLVALNQDPTLTAPLSEAERDPEFSVAITKLHETTVKISAKAFSN
jgi:hypothetical protein